MGDPATKPLEEMEMYLNTLLCRLNVILRKQSKAKDISKFDNAIGNAREKVLRQAILMDKELSRVKKKIVREYLNHVNRQMELMEKTSVNFRIKKTLHKLEAPRYGYFSREWSRGRVIREAVE